MFEPFTLALTLTGMLGSRNDERTAGARAGVELGVFEHSLMLRGGYRALDADRDASEVAVGFSVDLILFVAVLLGPRGAH